MGSVLHELQPKLEKILPLKPYAANRHPRFTRVFSRDKAQAAPYIQINQPNFQRFITVDVDHGDLHELLKQLGFPFTWICISPPDPNKVDGRGHVVFRLNDPVRWDEKGSKKAQRYVKAITKALCAALNGDPDYTGFLTKNPLSDAWQTTYVDRSFSLDELYRLVKPWTGREAQQRMRANKARSVDALDTDGGGEPSRNTTLFRKAAGWSYENWPNWANYDDGIRQVMDQLQTLNPQVGALSGRGPLPDNHLRSTAKSIVRYCLRVRPTWTTREDANRGRDRHLTAGLSPKSARQIAGRETGRIRAEARDTTISDAIQRLENQGTPSPTGQQIADEAGVSLSTVKRWRRQEKAQENQMERILIHSDAVEGSLGGSQMQTVEDGGAGGPAPTARVWGLGLRSVPSDRLFCRPQGRESEAPLAPSGEDHLCDLPRLADVVGSLRVCEQRGRKKGGSGGEKEGVQPKSVEQLSPIDTVLLN